MAFAHSLGQAGLISTIAIITGIVACGASEGSSTGKSSTTGQSCTTNADCDDGVCVSKVCRSSSATNVGGNSSTNGTSTNVGGSVAQGSTPAQGSTSAQGSTPAQGSSTSVGSTGSVGVAGTAAGKGAIGSVCAVGADCQSGSCVDAKCVAAIGSGTNTTTVGPQFAGSGTSFRPLTTGCPPSTKDECTGACEGRGGDPAVSVIRPPATLCFWGDGDVTPEDPAAVIEQVIESVNGQSYVHIRVTFDPRFVDNTYGTGACCGWSAKRGHTMKDVAVSDHTELLLTNAAGDTVLNFKIDLVHVSTTGLCGYESLGVSGGDGSIIAGDPKYVLGVATSMDRNLNGCGYCAEAVCDGDCTVNSPKTDENYTANPGAPNWDYRQVYEVWVALDAFAGQFGQAYITYTHASPAKTSSDTLQVTGAPCPSTWTTPYCPPGATNCFGTVPPGGGTPPPEGCQPNYQYFVTTEGAVCTPIPFAGWPNMAACPDGYKIDLSTEGRYCIKI